MTPDSPRAAACDICVAALRRPLSQAERHLYDEHLSSCGDCRLMARMNADVAPLGDLRPGDEALVARTAEAVLARLSTSGPVNKRRAAPGLLAVVLMVGTSAVAVAARRQLIQLATSAGAALFPSHPRFQREHALIVPPTALHRASLSTPSAQVVPPFAAGLATGTVRIAASPAAVPIAVPATETRPRRHDAFAEPVGRRDGRRSASREGTASPETSVRAAVQVSTEESGQSMAPAAAEVPAPRELLASGAAARARGDRAAAVDFFRQLQVHYSRTIEAQVALVSSGQLWLDAGDFNEALAAFRAYIDRAPSGSLLEESLDGAARALAGLRRFDDERTVWREIVTRFPRSAYLSRATRRLRDLR